MIASRLQAASQPCNITIQYNSRSSIDSAVCSVHLRVRSDMFVDPPMLLYEAAVMPLCYPLRVGLVWLYSGSLEQRSSPLLLPDLDTSSTATVNGRTTPQVSCNCVRIEVATCGLDSTRGWHLYHLYKFHSLLHTGPLLLYCAFCTPAPFRGGDGSVRNSRARSNPCVLRLRPKLPIIARVRQKAFCCPPSPTAPPCVWAYTLLSYCCCRYCQPHVPGVRLRYDLPCVAPHNPPGLVATSRAFSRACTMHISYP